MNLLQDPWIPVRDAQGRRDWITPDRLCEPQWQAFDADRPDFNGALAQFAIGLLQTTTPVANSIEWRALFREPPTPETLRRWFEPVTAAFEFDGEGPRFMQDIDLGKEGVAVKSVGALLIDTPGEQALENNTDHFVKRNRVDCLCAPCAAAALLTLQTNAPSGGSGHRTSLRGGGPLTTLLIAPEGKVLWHQVWLNVRDQPGFLSQGGDPHLGLGQHTFPWLGPIAALQKQSGELAMAQVHPLHHFWAMPRRIRLDFEVGDPSRPMECSICGRSDVARVRSYGTKNQGLNYKGEWNHPLSPYYLTKEGWLPLHPQSDGLGYRHWLAWVLGVSGERQTTRVAPVVVRAVDQLRRQIGANLRLWVFGYDMDNMKACCWYESSIPLYGVAECESDALASVQTEVGRWLEGAEQSSTILAGAVRSAWFDPDTKRDKKRTDQLRYVEAQFWSETEMTFYRQLHDFVESVRAGTELDALTLRASWHRVLVRVVLALFDKVFVGVGAVERQNPRRVALAHRQLVRNLHGPKLKRALGLPVPPTEEGAARKRAGKSAGDTHKEPA